jgi:hypothetical protein
MSTQPQNAIDSPEVTAIARCDQKMNELKEQHADWFELFDDTLPDSAPRAEVVELMMSAPNDFALGLMYGKFTMRLELEAVTGRDFA